MRRMVTRALILAGLLVLGLVAGVVSSGHDFSATEKGIMVAVVAAVAAGGIALQVSARRRID